MPETLPFSMAPADEEDDQLEMDFDDNEPEQRGWTPEDLLPLINSSVNAAVQNAISQYRPAPAPQEQKETPKWDDVWYNEPGKAAELIRQSVLDEVNQRQTAIQAENQAQQVWQQFAANFPALADNVDVAKTVWSRNPGKYRTLEQTYGTMRAMTELAEDTGDLLGFDLYEDEDDDELYAETAENSFNDFIEDAENEDEHAGKASLVEIHKRKVAARRAAGIAG